MANSIIGIPTSRLSDLFVRNQLLNQLQLNQSALFRTQTQLSTGHRYETISDDPVSALSVISLQSLLERKAQIQKNINDNQSYLGTTDSALSSVSGLLTQARATALGVVGNTATETERNAAAQEIFQTLEQLINTGNSQFRGRYLFSGSESTVDPFQSSGNVVRYAGNEQRLSSYDDINLLFDTNVNGNEVFGAISAQVQGNVTVTPALTYDTRLADLRQGRGISKGSILVSDGNNSSAIDISGAETIGDLAAIIHAHPPLGRELNVDITADKIILQLDAAGGGSLSIREVGGGTVAYELGIRRDNGVGNIPVYGRELEPALDKTTSLQNILGAYANAVVHSSGRDNDIRLQADVMGAATATGVALNNVSITLVNDPAVHYGHETVDFDPVAHTVTVHIDSGATRAFHVVNAINNAHDAGDIPFTAEVDPTDNINSGQGLVQAGAAAVTRDGAGEALDQQSGLLITNGDQEFNINFATSRTVEDVLNAINANTGLLAEINTAKNGINIRSRISGADFMIGENGGKTAAQLGLRSFTQDTSLTELNLGRGVGKLPDSSLPGSHDFAIVRTDGVELDINIAAARTIGDVLSLINDNADNADGKLVARLAVFGNGIELIDNSGGGGDLEITADESSSAAADLGLIPTGESQSAPAAPVNYAAKLTSTAANSGIIFTAKDAGIDLNGVEIEFDSTATGVNYDDIAHKLTIGIILGTTTANDVVEAVNQSDFASLFYAALDPTAGNPNDGTGNVENISEIMTAAKELKGRDVNQLEIEGVFTALLRLKHALEVNDFPEIQRAIGLLDDSTQNMNFTRAELGTRQQGLDVMEDRLETENIELQEVLSNEYDADLSKVVSDMAGQQAALEASLRATASIMKLSLLDFL